MLQEINIQEIDCNAFEMFNKNWALVTSGDEKSFNTMTISWGTLGHMWHKDIAVIVVRPTRYTYDFIEKNDYFTVSFFLDAEHKKDLGYLGRVSGRDEDKLSKTALSPVFLDGTTAIDGADYVFVCKKAHAVDYTREQFIDKDVEAVYTDDNLHRQYTGIIQKVYKKA